MRERKRFSVVQCPQCGAPMDPKVFTPVCRYCGSYLRDEHPGFVEAVYGAGLAGSMSLSDFGGTLIPYPLSDEARWDALAAEVRWRRGT